MRTALNNPFSPGSDLVPAVWAGRVAQLSDWENVVRPRRLVGLSERGRTIVGEAGLGKSTLVRRIVAKASESGGWATGQIRVPAGSDPFKLLASALLRLSDSAGLSTSRETRVRELLSRVRSVSVNGFSLNLDKAPGPEPHQTITELLFEIGRAALANDTIAIIHLDEVQNISDHDVLSQLLIALGDAIVHLHEVTVPGGLRIDRVLPLAVYLTGLPDFLELSGASKGATFSRRFATVRLGPLSDDDLALALQEFVDPGWEVIDLDGSTLRIQMTQAATKTLISLCLGEPFLFQLLGERTWYAGESPLITEEDVKAGWMTMTEEAADHVERILTRLPAREHEFLRAMASLDPQNRTGTEIAKQLGLGDVSKIGTSAQRLDTLRGIINRGKPYTFRHRAIEGYLTSNWPHSIS